jgi:hypothetical protein
MNDQELQTLILSNYENDAQTLTSNTESNLLKFKELMGIEEESRRWASIKHTLQQNVKLKGLDTEDPLSHVIAQLSNFNDGLYEIRQTLIGQRHFGTDAAGFTPAVFTFSLLSPYGISWFGMPPGCARWSKVTYHRVEPRLDRTLVGLADILKRRYSMPRSFLAGFRGFFGVQGVIV